MHIHDVIDDVTRSQNMSNFEIDISPSIFELERRSKAQNIGNANGYLSGIFNFRYNFRWKSLSRAQIGSYFENFEILNTASIWPQIWKDRPKFCPKKFYFVVMTSSMTSQGASNFFYIFMFRRGWLREQIARAMSRQQMPISYSFHRCGRLWRLVANQQGSYDNCEMLLYVLEHKAQYILIHAPFTRIVVFRHIGNVPQWFRRVTFAVIPPRFV